MSSRRRKRRQQQMLEPELQSVEDPASERSSSPDEPQDTSDDIEAKRAQQACQNIFARIRMAKQFQQYRANPSLKNRYVTLTSHPPSVCERINLLLYDNKKAVPLTVRNTGDKTVYMSFWASDFVKDIFTISDSAGNTFKTIKQHILGPGETYKIIIHFHSDHAGFYEMLLVFQFKTCQLSSDSCHIMRLLEVIHRTSIQEEPITKPKDSLLNPKTAGRIRPNGAVVMLLKPVVALKGYGLPRDIEELWKSDKNLQSPLTWGNFSRRFSMLLHLEELQMKKELDTFAQKSVPLFRHSRNSDIIVLQIEDNTMTPISKLSRSIALATPILNGQMTYKGWVQHVDMEQVYLTFCEMFMRDFRDGMMFKVNFVLNRLPLRLQHRAAALAEKHALKEVLFPTGQLSSHRSRLLRLDDNAGNPEQCTAIKHIVASTAKPVPYLLFGPPGTGKTVTLVESMKQIVKTQPRCKILACAPSNSATDHLCEKLVEAKLDSVYRLYALTFPLGKILKDSKFCCNLDNKTGRLMIPSKGTLMSYNIVVTTLQTAGRLVSGGIRPGHYTYIFVDEAGQASETECIIPIAGLAKLKRCQVVLAGDPKQLGPVITSRIAQTYGLGVSLLERLMTDNDLYKSHEVHGFNKRFVTKLLRNYRSHPAILQIPNELFYDRQLQPHAPEEKCNLFCKWKHLPKKDFPLIFHGVAGTDEREPGSPSYFNMAEVEVLKEYLKALINHLHGNDVTKVEPGEIGIIAPYRKQVEKIQAALQLDKDLKEEELENILVGSVEQFQGKEYNAILVSTVRSNPKLTARNQKFTLGFLDNEKRFNVAITRARALLIVVGDPRVLKTDPMWNKFITYCTMKGGYRGITAYDAEGGDDGLADETGGKQPGCL